MGEARKAGLEPLNDLEIGLLLLLLLRNGGLELAKLAKPWAPERDAPRKAVAHGPQPVQLGRRTVGRETGPHRLNGAHILKLGLDQVWKLQILEEQIEELLARETEDEIVLALGVGAAFGATTASATLGLADDIADRIFPISREDEISLAAGGA